MRSSLSESPALDELPIGRLCALTLLRVTTAEHVHHRAGPWTRCEEDDSRVVRIGAGIRPPAVLEAGPVSDADELPAPLILHRDSEPAFA